LGDEPRFSILNPKVSQRSEIETPSRHAHPAWSLLEPEGLAASVSQAFDNRLSMVNGVRVISLKSGIGLILVILAFQEKPVIICR
jgi:hypothetical protein